MWFNALDDLPPGDISSGRKHLVQKGNCFPSWLFTHVLLSCSRLNFVPFPNGVQRCSGPMEGKGSHCQAKDYRRQLSWSHATQMLRPAPASITSHGKVLDRAALILFRSVFIVVCCISASQLVRRMWW